MADNSTIFFGYASKPEVNRDALSRATGLISKSGEVEAISWEALKVDGKVIVTEILSTIDQASACLFDVSSLNQNVLFEVGFAIARQKPVMLLLDSSDIEAKKNWEKFSLLKSVGYTTWANSEEIKTKFLSRRPDLDGTSLSKEFLGADARPLDSDAIFHIPSANNTEPARLADRRLEHERMRGIRLVVADPTESATNPIDWYASRVYESGTTIVHFESPRRALADVHNPRSALVAGFARGLDRNVLLLAETDYAAPLDYQDLLKLYENGRECEGYLDSYLRGLDLKPTRGSRTPRVQLATELRTLRFGEHVAENEQDDLEDYFVVTSAFDDVIADRNALFVGRKGTGKTANMLQASTRLGDDARNLVVVVKPASYEFSSLVGLLERLPISLQQYSIEALWRFLLTSEIAKRVLEVLRSKSAVVPYTAEERLLVEFSENASFDLSEDFGVRFERAVTSLDALGAIDSDADGRDFLNEALQSQAIQRLRSLLGPVLKDRNRVALLIDNLDKGWERSANLDILTNLLLGLLSAVGTVKRDFSREDYWRDRVSLTIATFLRSDIYAHLLTQAREPDKIPASRVTWDDPETLIRVVEERFLAARPEGADPKELWSNYFAATVGDVPTREYMTSRVLPRPRDLIYFCNSVAGVATNRGNSLITEDDVLEGERLYSQFAFEALVVENGVTMPGFADVLFGFLAESEFVTESRVRQLIASGEVADEDVDSVFDRLRTSSFLGFETAKGRFEFPSGGQAAKRAEMLAKKYADTSGHDRRYQIHPAFRAYLEIAEQG